MLKPVKKTTKVYQRSYANCELKIDLVAVEKLINKKNPYPTEKRALLHEFSDKENMVQFIRLDSNNKKMGRLTTNQIKDILNDIGFKVNPLFGKNHYSDFQAVMNIGGYSIPGWVKLARTITKYFPSREKLLLMKLSPGKDRLHVRFFENNDGSWLIAAHTDHNWLSLNIVRTIKSHVGSGAGDFITGTLIFFKLLNSFDHNNRNHKELSYNEIHQIIKSAYEESVLEKLNLNNKIHSYHFI